MVRRPLASALLLVSLACDESRPMRVPVPELEALELLPGTLELARGQRAVLQLFARLSDGSRKDVTVLAAWTVSDSTVAHATPIGEVEALSVGSATIRAAYEGHTATAELTVVASPLTALSLAPDRLSLVRDTTGVLMATALRADGSQEDVSARVEWSSSSPAVASVSMGTVQALAPGSATVSASLMGFVARAVVEVSAPPPTGLSVHPPALVLAVGQQVELEATAEYAADPARDVTTEVSWRVSNTMIAAIDAAGRLRALAEGISTVTAELAGTALRTSVTLRVGPAVVERITVTPPTAAIGRTETQRFQATGVLSDGSSRDLTTVVEWSSSDPAVATVVGSGPSFVGVSTGTVSVIARDARSGLSSEDGGGSARLTVTPPVLRTLGVLPMTGRVAMGGTLALRAVGLYSDGSSAELAPTVDWIVGDPAVAAVDVTGQLTPLAPGVTLVEARDPLSGISSSASGLSAQITVVPPELEAISVGPSISALIVGNSQLFTAAGLMSDGSVLDLSASVQWISTAPTVLSLASNGLATALIPGTARVTAVDPASGVSSEASNGSAEVVVSAATLLSLAVVPTATTVPVGADLELRAIGTYDNNTTADLTAVVDWSSSAAPLLPVGNSGGTRGLVQALGPGSAIVEAVEPASGVSSAATAQSAAVTAVSDSLTGIALSPRAGTLRVSQSLRVTARGRFAGSGTFRVGSGLTWSTSNAALATVQSGLPGFGSVAALAEGTVTVRAQAPGGVSSDDSGESSLLSIIPLQQTLSATWPGPTVSVDGTANFAVNVGTASFAPGTFSPQALISDVNVAVHFLKTDGSCAAPASGNAFHNETNLRLQGPGGVQVVLAAPNTWAGGVAIQPVTVTFDDQAALLPSNTPVSGTFLPNGGSLAAFVGLSPAGAWTLQAGDTAGGDPLCVLDFTVVVTAQ